MNPQVYQWALKWGVPMPGINELRAIFGMEMTAPNLLAEIEPTNEKQVQSLVRLEAARKNVRLWRNNVGVLQDATGRPVRYGLANDSPGLNKIIKSGDLIGWRPLMVTPALVGAYIAQFVSRECKAPGWVYTATEHEQAQLKWIELINSEGGDARFVSSHEGSI